MSLLNRDQILTADDITTEDVPVPEWGGTVRVRCLTGTDRDAFEFEVLTARDEGKLGKTAMRAGLVARSIVDEDGKRVFTDADIHKLGMKSAAALDRVFEVAQRLARVSETDVDELAANLGETDSEPSPSDLPSISASPELNSSPVLTPQS